MVWFKVDDTFPHHAKVLAAGNAAVGLWVRAGAWSMQQLTDGHVPTHVARTLGTPPEIKRLIAANLWREVEGGYQFCDWLDWQRSKEQVEADRHAASERQRLARERAKSRRDSSRDTSRDSRGSHTSSHGPPDQTRPDQTVVPTELPLVVGRASEPPDGPQPKTPRRKRRLPEDWKPTDKHSTLAAELGVMLDAEAEKFRDHHEARGSTMLDWDAAFRNWLRNSLTYRRNGQPADKPRNPSRAYETQKPPDGLSPEEYSSWLRKVTGR